MNAATKNDNLGVNFSHRLAFRSEDDNDIGVLLNFMGLMIGRAESVLNLLLDVYESADSNLVCGLDAVLCEIKDSRSALIGLHTRIAYPENEGH